MGPKHDFGSFVSSDSIPLLEPDSSKAVESLESLNLAVGQYQGTYTVKSDSDDVTWLLPPVPFTDVLYAPNPLGFSVPVPTISF